MKEVEEINNHNERNMLAIPRRIYKTIHKFVKNENGSFKRKERLEKERELLKFVGFLTDLYCDTIDSLIIKDFINKEKNKDITLDKMLLFSKKYSNSELKTLLDNRANNLEKQSLLFDDIDSNLLERYLKDVNFNPLINKLVLLNMIEKHKLNYGPMYALIFGRAYDVILEPVMQYGYCLDEKVPSILDEYVRVGGSVQIMCLPYYFKGPKKAQYSLDDLEEIFKREEEFKKYFKERHYEQKK